MTTMLAPLSLEARKAIAAAVRQGLAGLRAEPPEPLSDWARGNFILAAESSQTSGGWECWSWQVGIADAMSNDQVEELAFQKSKRVGYTKLLCALVCWALVHRRRSTALWQPTDDDRDSWVKTELDPVIDEVEAVRRALAGGESTMKMRFFLGAVLHTLGGKAARAYRRITVQLALLDEWDAFDASIEKAGSPDVLAKGRLEGAAYPKFVGGSTPRIKGLSHVESARERADVDMRFHLTCKHCGVEHPLLWGGKKLAHGFKWAPGQPETVRHVCPHCHGEITQADTLDENALPIGGDWVCVRTGIRYGQDRVWRDASGAPIRAPRRVGMHIWAAYSPMRTWSSIVEEFEAAVSKKNAGNTEALQVFVNETLGETWELSTEAADEHELKKRAEPYALGTVPRGALVLVAAVDVQDNRFELFVYGIGRGEEMWLVDYQVLYANPADERDWVKLDEFLQNRYRQLHHGGTLGIEAVAVDTGGHFTHQVYNFCRVRQHRRVYAIAGASSYGGPIKGPGRKQDVNWQGKVLKGGVVRWEIGTDTAKDLLYARFGVETPGPGYIHFPVGLPDEFYAQLTAEGRVLQKTSTGEQYRWVKRRARNEALDGTVYCLWCVQQLDLHRYTERMWDRLEAAVQPPPDLFSPPPPVDDARELEVESVAAEATPTPAPEPRHRSAAERVRSKFTRDW